MDDLNGTLETLSTSFDTEISSMEFKEIEMEIYDPYNDEMETRPLPDGHKCEGFLSILFDDIEELFGESRLEKEGHDLMWGFVNVFDKQAKNATKSLDRKQRELLDLTESQDGSEVKSTQLEQAQTDCFKFEEMQDTFEQMRDYAALKFTQKTNRDWQPYSGSRVNHKTQTASSIESRDYLRAKAEQKSNTFIPQGTKIVIAGGTEFNDINTIWNVLSKIKDKYADMVLIHGGQTSGVEAIAAAWANKNNVTQIPFKPNFARDGKKRAGFVRNEAMLDELPKGVIIFPGTGVTQALAREARNRHLSVMEFDKDGNVS